MSAETAMSLRSHPRCVGAEDGAAPSAESGVSDALARAGAGSGGCRCSATRFGSRVVACVHLSLSLAPLSAVDSFLFGTENGIWRSIGENLYSKRKSKLHRHRIVRTW